MTGTCPRCGEAISGVATHGPGDHRARPCGHRIGGAAMRRLVESGGDAPEIVADGGEEIGTPAGATSRFRIGHFFADVGVETEPLSAYGDVHRFGLDPNDTRFTTETYTVDLSETTPDVEPFDLCLFHPPCHKWTQRADEDAENLIPRARDLADELCDEWIIENQTEAPLRDPVVLDGSMFGLPVEYERGFETSYPVEQPLSLRRWSPEHRVENTRPKQYWKAVKGVTGDYPSKPLILSGTPAPYIHYLVRPLVDPNHSVDSEQTTLVAADGGRNDRSVDTDTDRSGEGSNP